MIAHQKVKSVAKVMLPRGNALNQKILNTLAVCADLVGSTLGPAGQTVLIERQEVGLPPFATKDGVSVYKAIGFSDPLEQLLLEASREASIRTAQQAGDGTTTATILTEALVRNMQAVTAENPEWSSQRIADQMEGLYQKHLLPALRESAIPCDGVSNRANLLNVARISANGELALAEAVLQCYDVVGDKGHVTITEATGKSEYHVEQIQGFPVAMGYEESCGAYFPEFITDHGTQMCVMNRPLWILYNGAFSDYNEVFMLTQHIAEAASSGKCSPNVVVVANGFSDIFRAQCATTFKTAGTIRVFPLLAPRNIQKTSQLDFLEDLAALTGARVFNPLTAPLADITGLSDLGGSPEGPTSFEIGRFRGSVVGRADELAVISRAEQIDAQLEGHTMSQYDRDLLTERRAKLVNGIARLVVSGGSSADVKERRDRAEDAVLAVRNAISHGALLGGGITWLNLRNKLLDMNFEGELEKTVALKIIAPALEAPVRKLFANAGHTVAEVSAAVETIASGQVYDLSAQRWMPVSEAGGLLDSFGAVAFSLGAAIETARNLGRTGGAIAFPRDSELDRREGQDAAAFMRAIAERE